LGGKSDPKDAMMAANLLDDQGATLILYALNHFSNLNAIS